MKDHLRPVGKKAPPRPRSSDAITSSITACEVMPRAFASAWYPPIASYSASLARSCSLAPARTSSTAIAQLLDDLRHVIGLHVRAVVVVDRHDRRPPAAAEALDRPHRYLTVWRRLARVNAELLLECLEYLLGADERARHVRAHLDHVPADGRQMQHVVEGRGR